MTGEELIQLLQDDLKNERKHLAFYLQASVMVRGLHREELSEFFLEEAKGELEHVHQFSELIVHLGGEPGIEVNPFPSNLMEPYTILNYVVEMEQEVSKNYARRLVQTEAMGDAVMNYVHLFYEDQLQDSQKTAMEVNLRRVQFYQRPNFDWRPTLSADPSQWLLGPKIEWVTDIRPGSSPDGH